MNEFVLILVRMLDGLNIHYAIGGSVASSYYGRMRTTEDIDISIELAETDVAKLLKACEEIGFYIPLEETNKAAQSGGAFSLNDGFWKADLFVVKESDVFAMQAFHKRRTAKLPNTEQIISLLLPEDVIIHKLRWCEGKPLEKHLRDIAAVVRTRGNTLDLDYIEQWVESFGAGGLWAIALDWAQK